MVAVGEIENKVLSKFQSRVHLHLQGYMVPPDPPIFLLNFNKKVLVERQAINESGGKNRKNPSENTNFLPLLSALSKLFEFLIGEIQISGVDNNAALRMFKTIRKM
jgi:hypothetical protein